MGYETPASAVANRFGLGEKEGESVQIVESALDRAGRGLYARSVAGGVLMGLANLVPGISGGTMLLAAGI